MGFVTLTGDDTGYGSVETESRVLRFRTPPKKKNDG